MQLFGDDRERQGTDIAPAADAGERQIGGWHLLAGPSANDKSDFAAKVPACVAFEISVVPGPRSLQLRSRVEAWHTSGAVVDIHAIEGPAFWQTQGLPVSGSYRGVGSAVKVSAGEFPERTDVRMAAALVGISPNASPAVRC
jgi:hypothetical protein